MVEMLVVIAIMAMLLSFGAGVITSTAGKGISTGVATAEAMFSEAQAVATGKGCRTCVLVAKQMDNNSSEDLRRILVAYEQLDAATGKPVAAPDTDPTWVLSSRGAVLPEGVYFSKRYSSQDFQNSGGGVTDVNLGTTFSKMYAGSYYIYKFTPQGTAETPGMSFVIGAGGRNTAKSADSAPPKAMKSSLRDFGGFVLWRNGSTSVFRSPSQIGSDLETIKSGQEF